MTRFPKARPTKGPRRQRPRVRVHVFHGGGDVAWNDEPICTLANCGALRSASVHRVPETPEDANALDARKLGEART